MKTSSSGSKTHRAFNHDYCQPSIYLLTVTTEGRLPVLGHLVGDAHTAHIELSEVGEAVRHELYALCDRYPQLRLLQYQIMPDHVHVILHATATLPKPLGNLFSSWKVACGQAYARITAGASARQQDKAALAAHEMGEQGTGAIARQQDKAALAAHEPRELGAGAGSSQRDKEALPAQADGSSGEAALAPPPRYRRLFAQGFNDSILRGPGQLQHMIDYVRDNPRRLLLKRQRSPFFTLHRGLNIAGHTLDAIGNLDLLRRPLVAVHCRRHWTDEQRQAYHSRCLVAAQQGAVLIGAFISTAEKRIALAAHEQGLPLIHIMENGFADLYKPAGQAFYTCAEGRLLQLSLWPYHASRATVSREQCNAMNTLAESLAALCPLSQS